MAGETTMSIWVRRMICFLFLISFISAYAQEGVLTKSWSIVVERSLSTGREQMSVTFESDKAIWVSNSNFALTPSSRAFIGVFESLLNDELKYEMNDIVMSSDEIKKAKTPENRYISPHQAKLFVRGEEVAPDSEIYEELIDAFERLWESGKWKARDGVEFSLQKNGTKKLTMQGQQSKKLTLKDVRCENTDQKVKTCKIQDYGSVYLSPE